MRITFLGTCAGTEPMPGRQHMSFVVEQGDALYWFDAGEGCARTAHLDGIDLLSTRAIFITHRHMDHVGGLPNLLWTIRKLNTRSLSEPKPMTDKSIKVFIPDMVVWNAVWQLLRKYQDFTFDLEAILPHDGLIFDEDGLKVTAIHNHHLGEPAPGEPWESFSYRVDANDSSVVYSGDVASIEDFGPLIDDSDLVLMETGHHAVEEICQYLKGSNKTYGRLGLVHHGRAILADPQGELQKAKNIVGDRVFLAEDGMELEL